MKIPAPKRQEPVDGEPSYDDDIKFLDDDEMNKLVSPAMKKWMDAMVDEAKAERAKPETSK